jgi:hypothetical protein
MELEKINKYLIKLHGFADVENIAADKFDVSGSLLIKFNGDTGTLDEGEVELEFYGIESMCISFRLLAPVKLEISNERALEVLESNYLEPDLNFYQLTDDVGAKWWIYAKGFNVNILPIYYG